MIIAVRHGAARTWWDNGEPQSSGEYCLDERSGDWTFRDRDGNKTAFGRYERGRRRGRWSEWNAAGGTSKTRSRPLARPRASERRSVRTLTSPVNWRGP